MEGPRAPQDSEFPRIVDFLDSNLRPEQEWSITSEYPVAFSEANRKNIRIITESEKVVSHAVVRPMIIKTPAGLFKIAGLGSVLTASEHRNQGLSTKIIESCLEAGRSNGCDFAILWTNLFDFYRKMNFELAGSEMSVLIDRDFVLPSIAKEEQLKILESNKVAAEAIHRVYSQHTVSSIRSLEETRRYLQIPNSRVYTAWDSKGILRAYAIEGKGADLNGYVHEWGGGVAALLTLFAHIRKTQGRSITIIVPRHSQNLLRAFEAHRLPIHEGFLGMIKLIHPENLLSKIKKYARAIGVSNLIFEYLEGKFVIGVGEQIFRTESERDVVKLIFGPLKAREIHDFGKETADVLERVFPIGMWVWGWDSV